MTHSARSSLVSRTLGIVALAMIVSQPALAYRQPRYLAERPLETAAGPPARMARLAAAQPVTKRTQALQRFERANGAWRVMWDAHTAVPTRMWGAGIAAAGAMKDPAIAARSAQAMLDMHVDLLAPGALASDFALVDNVVRGRARSVVYKQTWHGLDVVGARIRFVFEHDRLVSIGSTATPSIRALQPAQVIDAATASARAAEWIHQVYGGMPTVGGTSRLVVLPVQRERGGLEHHVVIPVRVDSRSPLARWTVFVDAASGTPVARRQELHFGQGTIKFRVSPRYPMAGYSDMPASFATATINNVSTTSNLAGLVTWTGTTAASVMLGVVGTYVAINNAAGSLATATMSLSPGNAIAWDRSTVELEDAQLGGFIHTNIAKQYARRLDPDLAWLGQQIQVYVNENDLCNAYSELDSIHFFHAGTLDNLFCENSARVADIVYHEFGHSLHAKAFGSEDIDGALSEGISDYYGATITGDPATGTGWIIPDEAGVRNIDPEGIEYRWPDDIDADPHMTGLIISGALWDLRKTLVADLGQDAGVALADDVFYGVISRADDIPSSYAEALVTDDDDGNLANGTPHKCAIDRAFGRHGMGELAEAATHVEAAFDTATRKLHLDQLAATGTTSCPGPQITSVSAKWRLRSAPDTTTQALDLAADATGFAAQLPAIADGEVVQYQFEAKLDDGGVLHLPRNPVDRWYEAYIGPLEQIYCTDFETDPAADGWTLAGFQWGTPAVSGGTFDPPAAFSGAKLIGTVLTGDGAYPTSSTMTATSPAIQVHAKTVRLQYRRWLSTEDGFYDQASISADGTSVWENYKTDEGGADHRDGEWRFHDVDVSAAATDGTVQIKFELTSDDMVEYGGWNIDAMCIVAPPEAACGNGVVDSGEACDDGNVADHDGCSSTCAVEDGADGGEEDGGCCSSSGSPAGSLLLAVCTLVMAIGRRRGQRTKR